MSNFEETKHKLISFAEQKAMLYLATKYGVSKLAKESYVELTSTVDPESSSLRFNGKITCFANTGLKQVGLDMTINENDINVESEKDIQSSIENALNAQQEAEPVVTASLDGFILTDTGSKYLKVSHPALENADLGIVGKNEYTASPDKSELLQTIVKDAMTRVTSEQVKVAFTGEFKEPIVEKIADQSTGKCNDCGGPMEQGADAFCDSCSAREAFGKKAALEQKAAKKSWLTSSINKQADDCLSCGKKTNGTEDFCAECQEEEKMQGSFDAVESEASLVAIKEDMPMARMSDHLAQMAQFEEQAISAAQEKIKTQAVNSLISMLQGMGYGSARVAEVVSSKEGLDVMTYVEADGTTKAVNIPVSVKDSSVTLPKKSLVSTLISKGIDVKAKLSENFSQEILEKIAAIEERVRYEQEEANAIIAERPSCIVKEANESRNTMFLGDTDTLTVQKHFIPHHEDLKLHDKISDGTDQWEIVNMEAQQNDKNENSSSLWTLKKCRAPEADSKEPKTKISL